MYISYYCKLYYIAVGIILFRKYRKKMPNLFIHKLIKVPIINTNLYLQLQMTASTVRERLQPVRSAINSYTHIILCV